MSSLKGQMVLYYYAKTGEIDELMDDLSEIIVGDVMLKQINADLATPYTFSHDVFDDLIQNILDVFPKEKHNIVLYYKPYQKVDIGNGKSKKINSSGSLYKAREHVKTKFNTLGISTIKASSGCTEKLTAVQSSAITVDTTVLRSEIIHNKDEVSRTWITSYHTRHAEYAGMNLTEILALYRVLVSYMGPDLMRSDFNQQFSSETNNKLSNDWPTLAVRIIQLAKKVIGEIKEPEVKKPKLSVRKAKSQSATVNLSENDLALDNLAVDENNSEILDESVEESVELKRLPAEPSPVRPFCS